MGWSNEDYYLAAVRQNGYTLGCVKNQHQTKEVCLAAVKQNGLALQFVKNQTLEICLVAIEQNKRAFKFIDKDKFPDAYLFHKLLFS